MVHYQVLLCLDTYNADAIAINKLCKSVFFTKYLAIYVSSKVIGLFLV